MIARARSCAQWSEAHGRAATAAPSGSPTWPADDDELSGRELRRGDLRAGRAAQPGRHVDPVGLAAVDEGDPGCAREVVAHERRVGNHHGVAVLGDGDARRAEEAERRDAGQGAQVHADRDGEVGGVGARQDVVDGSAEAVRASGHLDRDGLARGGPAPGRSASRRRGTRWRRRRRSSGSPARRTGGRRGRRRARERCRPRARSGTRARGPLRPAPGRGRRPRAPRRSSRHAPSGAPRRARPRCRARRSFPGCRRGGSGRRPRPRAR